MSLILATVPDEKYSSRWRSCLFLQSLNRSLPPSVGAVASWSQKGQHIRYVDGRTL